VDGGEAIALDIPLSKYAERQLFYSEAVAAALGDLLRRVAHRLRRECER